MAICTFYQRGFCKFGDNCKNEHPGSQRDANRGFGSGFGVAGTNRFGAFGGGDRYRPAQQSGGAFGGNRTAGPARFHLNKDDIKDDLSNNRPIYPLSCYGPGRDAPRQLIEGPVEISPEELRLRYYSQREAGNEAAAQQEETQLGAKMQEQVSKILGDLNGAIKYVEDGANEHPNRLDIAQGKGSAPSAPSSTSTTSNPFSKPPANPFGGGTQTQSSTFGQTSTPGFGQTSTPAFGRPAPSAFGQPSNPGQTTSAFGQTSALGGGSAFGKPSLPGTSAFGQPSSMGSGSAFGQGSAFGKPSMPGGGSAFGQTSALGQQSAFGQPSAPGTTSTFGQPSVPSQGSAFGQTSALGQNTAFGKPAFGQSGFGQTSQPGQAASPFGQQTQTNQTSPFAQKPQGAQPSPFGQQPQQANPFSKPETQQPASQANPFGGSSTAQTQAPAFGQTGFGRAPAFPAAQSPASPPQAANPFATKAQSPAAAPSPFRGQAQQANPFAQAQQQQAPSPFTQQGQAGAAPGASRPVDPKDRFKEGKPEEYEGEQGKKLEEIYLRVSRTGRFNDEEEIPLVPPKCEWIAPVQ